MTFIFLKTCYNVNHGGDDMPVKIDVHTNIKDHDLTLESCLEIIKVLQESYQSIRQEMYQHFLGMKHLKHAIIAAVISFIGYLLTESLLFIYAMPVIVVVFMLGSIIIAEYLTTQTRKQIQIQIQHFIKQKELLLKQMQDDKTMA